MSAEVLIVIVVVVFLCIASYYRWYTIFKQGDKPSKSLPPKQQPVSPSPTPVRQDIDPFLQQVASEKVRTDAAVAAARQQYELELEKRYSDDVKLKGRLTELARANGLDKALIVLWEEIRYYPAWSKRDDWDKSNTLHLTDIRGSSEDGPGRDRDTESVEFTHGTQRFRVPEPKPT